MLAWFGAAEIQIGSDLFIASLKAEERDGNISGLLVLFKIGTCRKSD
jgi:hypothetical protein